MLHIGFRTALLHLLQNDDESALPLRLRLPVHTDSPGIQENLRKSNSVPALILISSVKMLTVCAMRAPAASLQRPVAPSHMRPAVAQRSARPSLRKVVLVVRTLLFDMMHS